MKHVRIVLAVLLLTPFANAASARITTNASTCPVATNATALVVSLPQDKGGASFTLSGTWTGTISFKATGDGGVTWSTLKVTPSDLGTDVSSTTGNGTWQRNLSGYTGVCMLASAAMTGTAIATITPSFAPFARNGAGAGAGGDTITSPNGTLTVGGTTTNTTLDVLGAAGKILAGATPALTFTPVLGVPGTSAGTIGTANGAGGGATTTWASAATTDNTIKGPVVVIPDATYVGCSTTSTTCTLTPMATVSDTNTTFTVTASSTVLLGSPVTLVTAPSVAKHLKIYYSIGQTVPGNCTTAGGTVQLLMGYKDKLTGITFPITAGTSPVVSVTGGGGAVTSTEAMQPGVTITRSGVWYGMINIYVDTGVDITYQPNQTVAASGAPCNTFAQFAVNTRTVTDVN